MNIYLKSRQWIGLLFTCFTLQLNAQFIQQGNKLLNAALASGGRQGAAVDISDDGNTAIVGVPKDRITGGALIYVRSNGTWMPEGQKLSGAGYIIGTQALMQGSSVTISADGNTVAIGDPNDNTSVGAVYIFTRTNGIWTPQGGKLVASGLNAYAMFGTAIDLSANGNRLVVGAPGISEGSQNKDLSLGGVFVFERSGGIWTPLTNRLYSEWRPSNLGQYNPQEGKAVAISGDGNTLAVGAPGKTNTNAGGSVIFWRFVNSNWDGYGWEYAGKNLGASVALNYDGTVAAVGEPYLYNAGTGSNYGEVDIIRFRGVWEITDVLISTTKRYWQGESVALSADGKRLVFDASNEETTVFNYNPTNNLWTEDIHTYQGTGAVGSANQTFAIAISGDGKTFLMGGPEDNNRKGAAWAFAYQPPLPAITVFIPKQAKKGTAVIITGTNLGNATSVTFGGIAAASITDNTDTSITAIVGDCAGGSVQVTTANGPALKPGFSCITTGLNSAHEKLTLSLYPNPAESHITVQLSEPMAHTIYATIYDQFGRVLFEQEASPGAETLFLDINRLPAGFYLLKLSDSEHLFKFIKE